MNDAAAGEVFSVLVTVVNESDHRVDGVHLQVDIQRSSTDTAPAREWTLAHAPSGAAGAPLAVCALESRAQLSAVVRHEIGLMAPHAVVCRVRYDRAGSTPEHWMTKYVRNAHTGYTSLRSIRRRSRCMRRRTATARG